MTTVAGFSVRVCVYIRWSVLQYESGGGERLKVQVFPHVLPGGRRVARSSSATLCFIFLTTAERVGEGGRRDGNYTGVTGNSRTLAKHLHSEGNAAHGTVEQSSSMATSQNEQNEAQAKKEIAFTTSTFKPLQMLTKRISDPQLKLKP